MSFYNEDELQSLGLARYGTNVKISKKASIYNPACISIGSHVRVDDFCVLSAGVDGIEIGNFVHVAVFSLLIGAGKIELGDFSNLSSRAAIYSSNDDYSGKYMTNPTVPAEFTSVHQEQVTVGRHVIIGSGSVVLPGVDIGEGVAIGSLSVVKAKCEAFGIYAGIPAKRIGQRRREVLELEVQLRQRIDNGLLQE